MSKEIIAKGEAILGIEFGSSRIKAVLISKSGEVLAVGGHNWENQLENGIWTYSLEAVVSGLQSAYLDLKTKVKSKYGLTLTKLKALGISAMMHGYLAFDSQHQLLTPFRTWRNTSTAEAAAILSENFDFAIPQRWSITHLYQAILNQEKHLEKLSYLHTLSSYVHYLLSGKRLLGINDASGMFPLDYETKTYDQKMIDSFEKLTESKFKLRQILPEVKLAGKEAGNLRAEGALLLDPSGDLAAGTIMCPPEGDAGTGMIATNAIAAGSGNISAGTSIFAMLVLDQSLKERHEEIDIVSTPAGLTVAMVHCNNCSTEINAWLELFYELTQKLGLDLDISSLYEVLFKEALNADLDADKIVSFNYHSGEHLSHFETGSPLLVRRADAKLSLANFMRSQIMSAFATLRIGFDILAQEGVSPKLLIAHGGIFKTKKVAQSILAAALNAKVQVRANAGEGGAFGIAILAAYALEDNLSLEEFVATFFADAKSLDLDPKPSSVAAFNSYYAEFRKRMVVERAAVESN